MSAAERHRRLTRIFQEACGLPPEARDAHVEAACGGDAELAREARELLAFDARASGPLPGAADAGAKGEERVLVGNGAAEGGSYSSALFARLATRGAAPAHLEERGEVGRGGMGAVLEVWDEDLRRKLAMKVMLGQGSSVGAADAPPVDPRLLARFLEEAQVTAQLDHPGIVPVHELGLDAQGRLFFTMKLVKGKTLKDVFAEFARGEGGWTQTRVLGLLLKVCEAMAYAHHKRVIHRDLKPANVMVGRYGEVYVMDWGLAKLLDQAETRDIRVAPEALGRTSFVRTERHDQAAETPDSPLFTMDGDVVGTPAYMPPEQAEGRIADMGPHSDVYALGAMLYQLLAGHMPYVPPGALVNNRLVWGLVQQGPPRSLQAVAPDAPAELAAICERAMGREPRERYADMSELAADLAAYVEGRVVRAYETGAWAEARKWVRRNKPLAAALGAAVLLLAAGVAASSVLAKRAGDKAAEAEAARGDLKEKNTELETTNEALVAAKTAADDYARRVTEEAAKVLRLSELRLLKKLETQADDLWPAWPERLPALTEWVGRARTLVENQAKHAETLAAMRARALPWSAEDRARDRDTHPRATELALKEAEFAVLAAELRQTPAGPARKQGEERSAALEKELAALSAEVDTRRTWRFATLEERWQHDVFAEPLDGLDRFEQELLAEGSTTPRFGWSMPKRIALAEELQRRFAPGGDCARAWAEAESKIAAAYPEVELPPQMGLVPIGPDPESGLWEFADVQTGTIPVRDEQDRIVLRPEAAVVFVLIRGARTLMGGQKDDPTAEGYDREAESDEPPPHVVELAPWFLSKYEVTQAQWQRWTGANPSGFRTGAPDVGAIDTALNPVEQMSWSEAREVLRRFGHDLPTEAQWEHGCRAGTRTCWWTGDERESLRGAVNIADSSARRGGATWPEVDDWPDLDDGYVWHAKVDTLRANPFGLHHVHGNVREWCRDGFAPYSQALALKNGIRPGDGAHLVPGAEERVIRGGAFNRTANTARSGNRFSSLPDAREKSVGVRPARALDAPR